MARIQVPAARATFSESSEGLLITIPANKNWFAILFLGFWLAIWLSGEVSVSRELIPGRSINRAYPRPQREFGEQLFLVAWLVLWSVGGAIAVTSLLWNLAGVEKVLLGASTLTTKREVLGIGPTKEYELPSMSNLRISAGTRPSNNRLSPFQILSGGTIAFDYGARTFRFGIGLDEAEAQQVIDQLKSRHAF
jgi:hypothetical protein